MGHHSHRTVTTLQGVTQLTLQVYRCRNTACPRFHQPTRPEEEGRWALPHGEFGLDVIALVGVLRYQQQSSIPQIHEELMRRGIQVAQRTVTNQLYRYEELIALYLADHKRLRERLKDQKQVILALDGLQPDVGHEVLWVLRDCCSGEVLVARSLLGATEKDLVPLLEEAASVCQQLDIRIAGVITDGQRSIRNAVASALPGIPHQLCHFHYLREAAKPIAAADLHAKKELKKHMRGVRPIERALEGRTDEEAEAVRGYCLAVRSALTDDGKPPLDADGLQLEERLRVIDDSIKRVAEKKGLPNELSHLQQLVQAGLTATENLWPAIQQAYAWVHQAAHLLANTEQREVTALKQAYEQLLTTMKKQQEQLGTLAPVVAHFCKVTASYGEGLFQCYQVKDLPRTNNDLEQFFGTARHVERRVTGRKRASPILVVRGSVRVVAAGASRIISVSASELHPSDVTSWRALRQTLDYRHEGRRKQLRFRRDPQVYLASLEQSLFRSGLPS
ncbi:MULE transposase, conserved domain [Ktedonobacter racemifer DSM 44963]|uniref:MULE transposase, conserved domain n=2 Tax=Ktedonobacter racemifer TaxID=363277 RepID=D6TY48_KTERA|nr:MULE transposase, conserved domain [Ktedonobacter racemifer DSM 44963]